MKSTAHQRLLSHSEDLLLLHLHLLNVLLTGALKLVELIGEYAEEVAREIVDGGPDMQQSFDAAERKWSKMH